MGDGGVGQLQELLGAEARRGFLWNFMDISQPSNHIPQFCSAHTLPPATRLVPITRDRQ